MTKKMIIVESPAKARTIERILKGNYRVESSVGHIRDLPKTRFGIDLEHEFQPEYVTISGKKKVIDQIQKAAKSVDEIYLAADPDWEGEAICWHLSHYLSKLPVELHRILFYEVTPQGIKRSLENPVDININKVNAQQGRRILDRIVGYKLSPLLWRKVRKGLSAGRVQSVALKLICDREREIEAFQPEEYWLLSADLIGEIPPEFRAAYHGMNGKKTKIPDETTARTIEQDIKSNPFRVTSITGRKVKRRPPPPFITSTLQQEAARRFRFPAQKTMRIAQSLYEGKDTQVSDVHGLITYMRTDSPRISDEARQAAADIINKTFGEKFVPDTPPQYKARKGAQEAHEAIRPTMIDLTPERAVKFLKSDELKLYSLIWERFIASQMVPAELNVTTIKIGAGTDEIHEFRAVGSEIIFPGFWKLTGNQLSGKSKSQTKESSGEDDASGQELPTLKENEILTCNAVETKQNFTKPPPRFSEASLVRELETQGIGRPSTYASILATIRQHDYVTVIERRFQPTELGFTVSDILTESFPEIISAEFTAKINNLLDDVEKNNADWTEIVAEFYEPFQKRLKEVEAKIEPLRNRVEKAEGVTCPECEGPMVIRWGKKGRFLSCAAFPKCRGTRSLTPDKAGNNGSKNNTTLTTAPCPECSSPLALKTGRYGLFLTCSDFPKCRGKGPKPEGRPCPIENCDGTLKARRGKGRRIYYGCSNYPDCRFTFNGVLIPLPCPSCRFDYIQAVLKKNEITISCPKCKYIIVPDRDFTSNG